MKRLILIDGNSLLHRAFHAIPPLTGPQGEQVNAVYGFASMLTNIFKILSPDYVAVTFDTAKKTFRHEAFQEYKATRKKAPQELYDQIPLIKELVEAFTIPIFECDGYEADDVLGTLVDKAKKHQDLETVVVTGDLDTLQLVSSCVSVATPYKGFQEIVLYDPQKVQERLGVSPSQVIDFKALKGDISDNIPGVPGIGEKTAVLLLKKYSSLHNIYEHINEIEESTRKKLNDGEKSAYLSQKLCAICLDIPLTFDLELCRISLEKLHKAYSFFERFRFLSLLKRLDALRKNIPSIQQSTLF
ncbi:hypothetical protein HYV56_02255 [Candidatus Peregrinibacteria bacterium]|nr:hypothetical protein [Candidatus Peregrinibacteria bacterium]